MGSETKPYGWVRDDGALAFEPSATFCTPVYLHPPTPTPAADGEADAWIVAGKQVDTWNQIVRECQPHLDGRMHPEKFAEMLMAYGASCARAALRARPLPPDDVRAVVERVREYLDETEPARHDVIEAMRDGAVDVRLSRSDLRLLLAHIQRTEG